MNDLNNLHLSYIKKQITEFLELQDTDVKEEWYGTNFQLYSDVFEQFIDFIDRKNTEKEKRRKLYEELKKEFE